MSAARSEVLTQDAQGRVSEEFPILPISASQFLELEGQDWETQVDANIRVPVASKRKRAGLDALLFLSKEVVSDC